MIVADLLAEDSLQVRLHTPSSGRRLAADISWCAPTEVMDPTPLLTPNALLLTNGIGLNISDDRTWDAYVERLAKVPVAAIAFGTGPAHRLLPPGLVKAATHHDVPLLEVPRAVPFLQVHRYVTNVLQAENLATVGQSWELADNCAHLAASGAPLRRILAEVAKAVRGPVAIIDASGSPIARWPESSSWDLTDRLTPAANIVPLPAGGEESFRLAARPEIGRPAVATLLAPAASILALQLTNALETGSRKAAHVQKLLDQVPDWQAVALTEFTKTFRSTGLNPDKGSFIVVAAVGEDSLSAAWRLRLILRDAFTRMRLAVRGGLLCAIGQEPRDSDQETVDRYASELLDEVRAALPVHPIVLKGPCESVDELRLNLHQAMDLVHRVRQPELAPELSVYALTAAAAGHGARTGARKLLAPVLAYDRENSSALLETLRAYLENDCQPSKACKTLFIHRNTLALRLHKLEFLLHLRLDTLEGQAASLMALQMNST